MLFRSVQLLIFENRDPFAAAKRYVPGYIFLVGFIISMVTLVKGLSHVGADFSFIESLLISIAIGAFLAVGLLVATRCLTSAQARTSVDWSILVVIGAGLGIASAMEKTGAAAAVAQVVVAATSEIGPMGALVVIYVVCLLMAEMLHHNAAVAIMFPIAIAAASQVGADPRGFVMAVAVAGCCAFASPVTYQTHLIVYGPGGYRFTDFVRVGAPLALITGAVALLVIPWVWPL